MEIQQSLAECTQDSSLTIEADAENVELLSLRIKLTRSVMELAEMNLDDIEKVMELSTVKAIESPQLVENISKMACGKFPIPHYLITDWAICPVCSKSISGPVQPQK